MQRVKVSTVRREELVDVTSMVEEVVARAALSSGLCILYCPHTTAAITINEGADPSVSTDLIMALGRLVPEDWGFSHLEGNSDAHVKASLIGPSETLIVEGGKPVLGTWQKIFFCEFDGPRKREFFVKVQSLETAV